MANWVPKRGGENRDLLDDQLWLLGVFTPFPPISRQVAVLSPSPSSSCPSSLGQGPSPGTSSPPLCVSIGEGQLS